MKYTLFLTITLITLMSASVFSQVNNSWWKNDNVQTISGTVTDNSRPCGFIKADDGKIYKIHMGPVWYWDRNNYALALTTATIKGSVQLNNGENEIYPFVITQNDKTMTLTDDNGIPKWSQGKGNGYGRGYGWRNGNCNGKGPGNGNCCRYGNGNGNGNGWGKGNCRYWNNK